MATHEISILGDGTAPDSSGNVYQEPTSLNFLVNDRFPVLCWVFKDTSTRLKLFFKFRVPNNYVGTAKIVLVWGTTVTTGKVVWEIDYKSIANTESADPSTDDESTSSTGVTVPGTARLMDVQLITLTSANFVAGDQVFGCVVRDGADTTNDTAAADAYLLDAYFQYSDV